MYDTFWQKQEFGKPLFPELEWSRPENKQFAGKLAVIGGNLNGFAAPAEAYGESMRAGIGTTRVLLPLAVKKIVKQLFETVEFGASNPSGSFSQQALSEWLDIASWADGVLLAGDLGRNSETAIVYEKFLQSYSGPLTITKDAVEYALNLPNSVLNRPNTLLVLSMSQLQKLGMFAGSTQAITLGMDLLPLISTLHNLTELNAMHIVTKYHDTICVASSGWVSTTKLESDIPIWRVRAAAHASVWWLQNPTKTFEALTTAVQTI